MMNLLLLKTSNLNPKVASKLKTTVYKYLQKTIACHSEGKFNDVM